MLPELLKKTSLFSLLYQIDLDLAKQSREQGCPYCQGPLHQANYDRKPWGIAEDIPHEQRVRQSLCCGREGCRRRVLPPSCIFWGRRKYWAGIILVIMTLRQNRPESASSKKLMTMFGICRVTLFRWISWFREEFPVSQQWKRIRGRISASINSNKLPGDLLDYCIQQGGGDEDGFVRCLRLLAGGMKEFYP
jgi:hypothetical protein